MESRIQATLHISLHTSVILSKVKTPIQVDFFFAKLATQLINTTPIKYYI